MAVPSSIDILCFMEKKKTELINSYKILSLLKKNADYYFTITDITHFTGISRYRTEHILSEFETMALVSKRVEHFGASCRYYYKGTLSEE
ncbi:MAG: hypothetical protein RR903_09305 [Edwardsiella sp. (in: enterobacteria)]|nr:hypothetical protein [Edwardsiella piscicida]ELM3730536.1 hypothetical protein [Edwardsiella piscicida]ELV7537963.1 hypothetical protein [Edwardsiella piscicida]